MANETTTTTLEEIVYTEAIVPVMQAYQAEYMNPLQFCLDLGVPSNGSSVVKIPRFVSDMGTVGDSGTGVATAYNATEVNGLSNTQLDMAEGSVTINEYGILREISDTALEDNILGGGVIDFIFADAVRILATACNDDVCALFASFSNTSGSTGVDMAVATMDAAITAIRARGTLAPGGLVAILDQQCMSDFEAALKATGSSWAVYPGTADRLMAVTADANNGLGRADGYILSYRGVECYETGLTDTANSGADVVSAVFPRGDVAANFGHASIASAYKRLDRPAMQTEISTRTTKISVTRRWGCGLVHDGTGQKLLTDA